MRLSGLALLLLAAATAASGADREFDRLVSAVETHYGVKRTHIPLMGVANLFLKVAHPAGASGVKLAIFDDLPAGPDDFEDVDRFVNEACRTGGLHPLIVTHSGRGGDSSYILAGETGKTTRLLIATFERRQATLIEAEVNMDTLIQLLASPEGAHRQFGPDSDRSGR
jgi:hypothetical protein